MSDIRELEARLNLETGRISWAELQPYFARGLTIRVAPELDLVQVGRVFVDDQSGQVKTWISQGQVGEVSAEQARDWFERDADMWALVVMPWVLVQEVLEH